jgi:hypothetical protein
MTRATLKGALIASAVAGMFSAGAALAADKADSGMINCAGVNSCKGKGACNSADNSCAGQNGCKGKGWVKATAKDCKAQKGTVVASKKM